jgi:hypothetical protein
MCLLPRPPSTVIANSLFITGCWKTTWAWIEETVRKPNGREEKRTTLSVVPDQGQQKRLREQRALLCKPSRDEDSLKLILSVVLDQGRQKRLIKQRALLCKPSRDEDSRKLNPVSRARSKSAKKAQVQRAFMQIGRIYTENRISSL